MMMRRTVLPMLLAAPLAHGASITCPTGSAGRVLTCQVSGIAAWLPGGSGGGDGGCSTLGCLLDGPGVLGTAGQVLTIAPGALTWTWTTPTAPAWGAITGTLSAQSDLSTALAGKEASGTASSTLATHVAASDPHTQYRLESAAVPWADLSDVPSTFVPASHTQAASTISDSTAAGRALLTAATATAQRTALGLGTAATTDATAYEPAGVSAADITDGTTVGRAVLTASDAAAARTAIGAQASGSYEPARTAATQAEAEAGTDTTILGWSPLRVRQAAIAAARQPEQIAIALTAPGVAIATGTTSAPIPYAGTSTLTRAALYCLGSSPVSQATVADLRYASTPRGSASTVLNASLSVAVGTGVASTTSFSSASVVQDGRLDAVVTQADACADAVIVITLSTVP